jgi:glycosyltransferase involved in cell wall biosynthesis
MIAMSETPAVTVTVAIPTFRRPAELDRILPAVLEQGRALSSGDGFRVDVLVVDNDPAGTAEKVVRRRGDPDVRYVREPSPGIAAVRNRALDEAAARLLVFIDDDERPCPGWLDALLSTWRDSGAAAVPGRVVAEFTGDLDAWIEAGTFFQRFDLPTGTQVQVAATGNLLLDLDQIRRLGVRFETAVGLGGGEDTLFSRSLTRAGGRIVWCNESVAIDHVPPERMTRSWVLARSWSQGNASVLTDVRLAEGRFEALGVRATWLPGAVGRLVAGGARWLLGTMLRSDRHQARGARVLSRGAGMLAGVLGFGYEEYAREGNRHFRVRLRATA